MTTDTKLADDFALIAPLAGMHVGQLTATELAALSRLERAGMAQREYSGPSGLLGLGRVVIPTKDSQ